MLGKIALFEFLIIIAMAGVDVEYYRYNEDVIAKLHENTATLQVTVNTQQATILAQQQEAKRQSDALVIMQQSVSDAESSRVQLQEKLREKDIAAMARANSSDLETRINSATSKAFNDIVSITTPNDRTLPSEITHQSSSTIPKSANYQPPSHPPVTYPKGTTQ